MKQTILATFLMFVLPAEALEPIPGPEVRCWTVAVTQPFPMTDLHCEFRMAESYPMAVNSALMGARVADGSPRRLPDLTPNAGPKRMGAFESNQFPLQINVDLPMMDTAADPTDVVALDILVLKWNLPLESADAAPEADPLVAKVPFELWQIDLRHSLTEVGPPYANFVGELPERTLDLAPATDSGRDQLVLQANRVMIDDRQSPRSIFYVAVAPGTPSVTGTGTFSYVGTINGPGETFPPYPFDLAGPGVYVATRDALLKQPE
jgi:hypothetical protein